MALLTEKDSPFAPTRTQQIFHNTANLSLRGNTYDAKHLDKFLESGYGEKSLNPERQNRNDLDTLEQSLEKNRTLHTNLPPYIIST